MIGKGSEVSGCAYALLLCSATGLAAAAATGSVTGEPGDIKSNQIKSNFIYIALFIHTEDAAQSASQDKNNEMTRHK